jgi:hypothetical protein
MTGDAQLPDTSTVSLEGDPVTNQYSCWVVGWCAVKLKEPFAPCPEKISSLNGPLIRIWKFVPGSLDDHVLET